MMGNHADKRAAAAEHNARYAEREAVRPKLTKPKPQKDESKMEPPTKTAKPRGKILGFMAAMAAVLLNR